MSGNATKITIREVGLRDGLQSLGFSVPTNKKKEWFEAEFTAGVRSFEITSFIPKKILPHFVDAAEMVKFAGSFEGATVSALTPNMKGVELAVTAKAGQVAFVLSASETHNQSNLRRSTAESLADLGRVKNFLQTIEANKRPKLSVGLSTVFGCTFQGTVDQSHVLNLIEKITEIGVDEVLLADTVGYADPAQVKSMFLAASKIVDCTLAAHFHNTRGLGLANVLAALEAGIELFDASLGGFGGCPFAPGASGNIATEDLAFMLTKMGLETGINLDKLIEARLLLARILPDIILTDHISQAGLPKNFKSGN